jgi:hypothetical protein
MGRRSQIVSGARRAIGRMKPMAGAVARSAGRKYGVPLINRGIKKIRNRF